MLTFCRPSHFASAKKSIFPVERHRWTKNLRISLTENLHQSVRHGGLGYPRFSSIAQYLCDLAPFVWDRGDSALAIQGLCARGRIVAPPDSK